MGGGGGRGGSGGGGRGWLGSGPGGRGRGGGGRGGRGEGCSLIEDGVHRVLGRGGGRKGRAGGGARQAGARGGAGGEGGAEGGTGAPPVGRPPGWQHLGRHWLVPLVSAEAEDLGARGGQDEGGDVASPRRHRPTGWAARAGARFEGATGPRQPGTGPRSVRGPQGRANLTSRHPGPSTPQAPALASKRSKTIDCQRRADKANPSPQRRSNVRFG